MRAGRRAAIAVVLLVLAATVGWRAVRGFVGRGDAERSEAIAAVKAWRPGGLDGAALGQHLDDASDGAIWSASRRPDGSFDVSLSYRPYRPWGDEWRVATWHYQPVSHLVAAANAEAEALTDVVAAMKR